LFCVESAGNSWTDQAAKSCTNRCPDKNWSVVLCRVCRRQ